jgi:hypothetical protein
MTQARVLREAQAAGVSVHDILKRRIWLGESGEGLHATCEVEQSGDLAQGRTKRSGRAQRHHKMLYSMRIFSKEHENFDVQFWRPQHVTLKEDSRFPLQGCLMPVDPASWQRYNKLRDGPPQLTVAEQPPGLPFTTPHTPMPRPQPSATEAMSSTDQWTLPGALPKSKASPLFVMQMKSKAGPPVNPIADQDATDDGAATSPRSPTPPLTAAITWSPPPGGARSRSSRPRWTRSPSSEGISPSAYAHQLWSDLRSHPRSRSRSPRRPAPSRWDADEEWTEPPRSPRLSPTPSC